jgi:AcrR family transcriptional regulator
MARKYELKRRAERLAETRRRLIDAAIQLHRTKGPASTTMSDIAELAGVQRHTLYRHFPDERAIGFACSGHFLDENPPPDPNSWRGLDDGEERLRRGLDELYAFYERAGDMLGRVLRDSEVHPLTREMFELRAAERFGLIREVLAEPLPRRKRVQAALDLALDLFAWRRLTSSGLSREEAVETMLAAIRCQ